MCILNLLHVVFWQFSQKYECFISQIQCSIDLPLQTLREEPHISYSVMQKNGISIGQQRGKASHCCFAAFNCCLLVVVFFDIIYHEVM